jgi:hypothetical protein
MQRDLFLMLTIGLSALIFSTTASAQQKFTVSLNGVQENPSVNSPGGGRCILTLDTAETQITLSCSYSGLGSNASAAHIHTNGPAGVNGPVLFSLTGASGTSGTLDLAPTAVTSAQVADLRAKRWYVNIHTANFSGGEIRGQIKPANTITDVDGDGRTDITVFRQSDNTFYSLNSTNNSFTAYQFGSGGGDLISNSIANDFDGDGRYDPLIIKTIPTLPTDAPIYWSMVQSGSNTIRTVQWGNLASANSEDLVPADYDGDGKTDIAVYRRAEGRYYILESSTNTARVVYWGAPGNLGMVGDFDGDGRSDPTVVQFVGGQAVWHSLLSSNGQVSTAYWGLETDHITRRIPLDFDGDGKQDRVIRRPLGEQVLFCILKSSDDQATYITPGLFTDNLLFGDYDGDGKTDIVARRNVGNALIWFIWQSSNQQTRTVQFGLANDQ